jgi:hypothetical protein
VQKARNRQEARMEKMGEVLGPSVSVLSSKPEAAVPVAMYPPREQEAAQGGAIAIG